MLVVAMDNDRTELAKAKKVSSKDRVMSFFSVDAVMVSGTESSPSYGVITA